jgi:hypothetical protein
VAAGCEVVFEVVVGVSGDSGVLGALLAVAVLVDLGLGDEETIVGWKPGYLLHFHACVRKRINFWIWLASYCSDLSRALRSVWRTFNSLRVLW